MRNTPDTLIDGVKTVRQIGVTPWTGPIYSEQYVTNLSARDYVSSSAIIQGDRKSPYPWSYEIIHERKPFGTNIWSIYYSSNNWTSTVRVGPIVWDSAAPWHNGINYPTNLYNDCLSSFNEKVRGTLDLSVALAEAGSTSRMLKVFKQANDFISAKRNWRNIVKGVGNARLQYVYGWKPLMSDIYATLDTAINVVISEIEHVSVREGSAVPSGTGSFSFENYGSISAPIAREGLYTAEITCSFRTAGHKIDKWTSLNPLSIAWELTPYSFVVDWFVDVGSYLRNLETSLLYANSFVSGFRSEGFFFDANWMCNATRTSGSYPKHTYTVNASASYKYRKFSRMILSSYPAPRLPRFEADLGSGRLLNMAALLTQHLGRH